MTLVEWITLILSAIALVFSIVTFFIVPYRSRFNFVIQQVNDGKQNYVFDSFDGSMASEIITNDEEMVKPRLNRIALARMILINKSSLPLSIISYELLIEDIPLSFNVTSPIIDSIKSSQTKYNRTWLGTNSDPVDYIKPIINLQPYQAIEGYILFDLSLMFEIEPQKKYTLIIHTSRKDITFKELSFEEIITPSEKYIYSKRNDSRESNR